MRYTVIVDTFIATLILYITGGAALTCYGCQLILPNDEPCTMRENCVPIQGEAPVCVKASSTVGGVKAYSHSCSTESSLCGISTVIKETGVHVTTDCCMEDLCNDAQTMSKETSLLVLTVASASILCFLGRH